MSLSFVILLEIDYRLFLFFACAKLEFIKPKKVLKLTKTQFFQDGSEKPLDVVQYLCSRKDPGTSAVGGVDVASVREVCLLEAFLDDISGTLSVAESCDALHVSPERCLFIVPLKVTGLSWVALNDVGCESRW